jgi:hypothetical protein
MQISLPASRLEPHDLPQSATSFPDKSKISFHKNNEMNLLVYSSYCRKPGSDSWPSPLSVNMLHTAHRADSNFSPSSAEFHLENKNLF